VNDPTTGVQLLDYVERMLRLIGERELADRYELRDETGQPGVLLESRKWEDYLALGVTEIREYGSTSTQVMRRMRALLEGLLVTRFLIGSPSYDRLPSEPEGVVGLRGDRSHSVDLDRPAGLGTSTRDSRIEAENPSYRRDTVGDLPHLGV
jgi:Predicted membrane protein (DUF2254)